MYSPYAVMSKSMDREEKRIDITNEAVKHQVTIALALIAAIATLAKEGSSLQINLELVAVPLLISAVSGILVLMTIPMQLYGTTDPLRSPLVRFAGICQAAFFVWGLIAFGSLVWDPQYEAAGENTDTVIVNDCGEAPKSSAPYNEVDDSQTNVGGGGKDDQSQPPG